MAKILIIEDEKLIGDFYKTVLAKEGHNVTLSEDGEEGFYEICQGGWELILLDIMLPKKNGLRILEDLKKSKPLQPNGPIVVLSNLTQNGVIKEALKLGAAGFLMKTILTPTEVLKEINNYLEKKEEYSVNQNNNQK